VIKPSHIQRRIDRTADSPVVSAVRAVETM
jgi:hypothetical protein